MSLRVVEVVVPNELGAEIHKVFQAHPPLDVWTIAENEEDGRRIVIRALVDPDYQQDTLDALQDALSGAEGWHVLVMPLDAALPKPEPDESQKETRDRRRRASSREVLYQQIEQGAEMDDNYLLLVALSTVVAGVALTTDNVAVLIGAMVIAPFLGPNLAFAFGTALGDHALMKQAATTMGIGFALAVGLSIFGGAFLPLNLEATELLDRTHIGFYSVVIALASGACAALALTSGAGMSLVGVMVAVALLPPAVTMGIMLGAGHFSAAVGAAELFLVNVAGVNLSALIVFRYKGIEPRRWLEKFEARQSRRTALFMFGMLLILLCGIILLQTYQA